MFEVTRRGREVEAKAQVTDKGHIHEVRTESEKGTVVQVESF